MGNAGENGAKLMLIEPPADHSMQFSIQLSGKVVTEISQPLSLPPSFRYSHVLYLLDVKHLKRCIELDNNVKIDQLFVY